MNLRHCVISIFLGGSLVAAALGCGGGNGGGGSGGSGSGGGGGGPSSLCSSNVPASYDACSGTPFPTTGSCNDGSCVSGDAATKTFAAWKARALQLSGLSAAEFDARVLISGAEIGADGNLKSIDYLVVLDWIKSRQRDSFDFSGASSPPTDADIDKAVKLGIEDAEWTGLGAIKMVPSEATVQAAFDACQCDIPIDWCHVDFLNVTGTLSVRGIKELNAANNECLQARVDLGTGELLDCDPTPCAVN